MSDSSSDDGISCDGKIFSYKNFSFLKLENNILDYSNYYYWKKGMRQLLYAEGLHKYIEDNDQLLLEDTQPKNGNQADRDQARVWLIIKGAISNSLLLHVIYLKDPKKMWDTLRDIAKPAANEDRRYNLRRRMESL